MSFHLFAGHDRWGIRSVMETYRGTFPDLEQAKQVARDHEATWAEIATDNEGELTLVSSLFDRLSDHWFDYIVQPE